MGSPRDDLSARRLRVYLAGKAADAAIEVLRERMCDAVVDFVSAVAPQLEGAARLRLAVTSLRSLASGLEKDGAELLREEAGG